MTLYESAHMHVDNQRKLRDPELLGGYDEIDLCSICIQTSIPQQTNWSRPFADGR